ncbi:hypothetical protein E0Z10_g8461 [Xylaria hypoxylon]|uniref:NACHT domain-containing protein n=1 Tax=Xylaria hypoxylon TaxID=37992 RepID=A0A4Z0YV62_9PEZI|nr:hypothetical protein E0Z10_g8461 [Xylaria hypoxylon]
MKSFADFERDEIKPAKGVLQDAQNFLQEWLPKLGMKVQSELNAITCHNTGSAKSTLQTKEDFINCLNSIPLGQLSAYVDSEVNKMRDADVNLIQKRSKGFHRRAMQVQDFAVTFSQFLRAYSGIVDIVQIADSQYGNVAFAALSLFFAAEAEESIHACMIHISDRMPDFRVYERIYPDRDLGMMLAEAYRGVILFAREVTVYFQAHGFVRYMRHFNGIAEFQLMEQRMRENSNRISTRCDVLLAEKIDRLTKDNQILHDQQDAKKVSEIVQKLNLEDYKTKHMRQQLTEDQRSLRHQFGNDRRREMMDAQRFLGTTDGRDWESPSPMLLLLFGRNEIGSSSHDSWLSLVAAELAEGYLQSNNSVAYERCSKSSNLELTLSRLIFQFLERNPALIRRAQDFQEINSQISWNGGPRERVEALRMALLRIVNLHNGRVYIILDRPELCETQPEESCAEYITTMLSLVKEATAELKIMMVLKTLSVATGVVQFVDFTFRLVSSTRAIMKSGSGLVSDTNTLDAIARGATELSDALATSPVLASSNTTLQALVGECKTICRQAWQGAGSNINSMHFLLLLERLPKDASKTHDDMRQLMESLKPNAPKPTAAHPTRFGLTLDLANYFPGVIKQLADERSPMTLNQDFLESLYFSKIKARQRKIESVHSKTFGWIFRSSVGDESKTLSFEQWLREGCGTFWIQGKAGSGKSTLMKFICSHATTEGLLRGGISPVSFEILRKCPELIPRVSNNEKAPFRRRGRYSHADDGGLWGQEELMEAYRNLLVVRDLLEGFSHSDTIHTMRKRLERFPAELEQFFQHMIDSIPAIYLPHMARTLWMATSVSQPQFLMVYSLLDDASDAMAVFTEERSPEVMHDPEVRTRTQQMRRRIDGRCKGLLEVVLDEPDAGLYFEYEVDFLHRTVRDFLLGSSQIRRILEQQRFTELIGIDNCDSNVWLLPCLSIVEAFKRAPFRAGTWADVDAELAVRLLESLMMFAYEADANMTNRSALIRMLYDAEKTYDWRRWQFSWPLDTNLFLGLACQADLFCYIEKRISPRWFTRPSDSLRKRLSNSYQWTLHPRILQHLLKMGASLNAQGDTRGRSAWRTFLLEISSSIRFSRDEQVRETLRLLLKHDPELDTKITAKGGRSIEIRKLVEELLDGEIGEFQEEPVLELPELKENSPGFGDELECCEPEKVGSEAGIQLGTSWLYSWWNR